VNTTVAPSITATQPTFHPLVKIFPEMEEFAFAELVADIKANGIREPITIYKNQILDGRNRWPPPLQRGSRVLVRRPLLIVQRDPHVSHRFVKAASIFLELHPDPEFFGQRGVQGGTNGRLVLLDDLLPPIQPSEYPVTLGHVL
jgi:hypothetical protein